MSHVSSPVPHIASGSLRSVVSNETLPWGSGAFVARDHFHDLDVEDLCANETTTAALVDVLGRFGLRQHLVCKVSEDEDRLIFALDGDELGQCRLLRTEAYVYASTRARRPALLNTVVSRATHAGTLHAYLSRPVFVAQDRLPDLGHLAVAVEEERTHEFNGVAALWWRLRRSEGVDPEASRLMLNLTVPASTLRRLRFPSDGTAPTLLP